jgi:hypothetical protein
MSPEQMVELDLALETEALGENLPQCHFVHHKSHLTRPGIEPGPRRWGAGDYPPEFMARNFSGFLHMPEFTIAMLTKQPRSTSVYGLQGNPIQPRRGFLINVWPEVNGNKRAYLALSME